MPPGDLLIQTSNRLRTLAGRLSDTIRDDPPAPLEREHIVVQSQGMRRWLTLELARRLGCAASMTMPFPGNFCRRLARRLLAEDGKENDSAEPFSREVLTWRIMTLLRTLHGERLFEPVLTYISDKDPRKEHQLAARLAAVFDDYQMYRPQMLLEWQQGDTAPNLPGHAAWQSEMWRRLCAGDTNHMAGRFSRLIEILSLEKTFARPLPRRISVFAVNTLPPVFIEVLKAVARHSEVTLYLVSPSTVLAPVKGNSANEPPQNRLLAGMCGQFREFLGLIRKTGAVVSKPSFAIPERTTCLRTVQADILADVDRGSPADDPQVKPHDLKPGDDSISIHVCHSPLREMEVLRDLLIDAVETDRTLKPHDILVMMPEIDAYAPFIEAVFGVEHPGSPRLPFRIADRPRSGEGQPAEAFLGLLRLIRSRLTVPEILDLLETPAVRRAAAISAGELSTLRMWTRETGIRWGRDGRHRSESFGLPGIEANTWRSGMARLFMGFAAGPLESLVDGVLPHGHWSSEKADLLGRFSLWLESLFSGLEGLDSPRSLTEWETALTTILETFFDPTHAESDAVQTIRDQIVFLGRMGETEATAPPDIEPAVILQHLERSLSGDGFGAGFISGSITFCALKPMRTIPFRLVAIAGLENAAFPRRDRPAAFDLRASHPQTGDRSLRADDRQLFLECLMSAGDRLILSYVGRSQKDNSKRAASVVLDELLRYLDQAFRIPDAPQPEDHGQTGQRESRGGGDERSSAAAPPSPRDLVQFEHGLQPFNPVYFDNSDTRHFSYSEENCTAAKAMLAARATMGGHAGRRDAQDPGREADEGRPAGTGLTALPFVENAIDPGTERLQLTIGDLADCWINPSRHFCRRTLGLHFPREEMETEGIEPLTVTGLGKYQAEEWLARRRFSAAVEKEPTPPDIDAEWALVESRGDLPPGALGRAWHASLVDEVGHVLKKVGRPRPLDPQAVTLTGPGWILEDRLDNLTDKGRLQFRSATIKPKDLIRAWINHIVLLHWLEIDPGQRGAGRPRDPGRVSRLVGRDKVWVFDELDHAGKLLEALIEGYRQTIRKPVPLFEEASHRFSVAFTRERQKCSDGDADLSRAWDEAHKGWTGSAFRSPPGGDRDDPYVALCHRGREPLRDEPDSFREWSLRLWEPILTHGRTESGS